MPLPKGFEPPPNPPPANVPVTDPAWYAYHQKLARWLKKLADAIP